MALIDRSELVGLEGVAHLCTGGEPPWLKSRDAACRRFGVLESAGVAGRAEMFAVDNDPDDVRAFFKALDDVG